MSDGQIEVRIHINILIKRGTVRMRKDEGVEDEEEEGGGYEDEEV